MMSKQSLKRKEERPYKELVDGLPALGVYIGIIIIVVGLIIAGLMMQGALAQGHEVGFM